MRREDRRDQDRDEWFRRPLPVGDQLKSFGYCVGLWVLRVIALLFVLFGVSAIWNLFWHDRAPADAPMAEKVTEDEQYYFSEIVASTIRAEGFHRDNPAKGSLPWKTGDGNTPASNLYRRDVHTKSHGCVKAKFAADDEVPAQFRFGVFSAKKPLDAIIRFSSGKPDNLPDKTAWTWLRRFPRDVRGMAVKVLDLEGKRLLDEPDPEGMSQDFIATTSPVFFIRTIEQYSQFSGAFSRDDLRAYFLPDWLDPRGWHMHQLWLLTKSFGLAPDSLVREPYYSGSAYRLGPSTYVKFRLKPCEPIKDTPKVQDKADYLRHQLETQVAAGEVCFSFEVQPQVAGKNMPVEDTTVEWREKDSPFQKIATVRFDAAPNTPPVTDDRCENLEFNPWHSTEDFEPVGAMNRLRKVVYQQMANFRRTKNCELSSSGCPPPSTTEASVPGK